MKRCALAAALLCFCLSCAAIELHLKTNVEQTTMTMTLGDVLQIDADAGHRSPYDITLPNKGKVGDTIVFTRAELTRLLSGEREGVGTVRWTGAQRVLVQRRGVVLEAERYVEWAREQLRAHLAADSIRVELQPVGSYRALMIPDGQRSVTARFAPGSAARNDRVWLDLAVDGQYYNTIVVTFDVRRFAPALVLRQAGAKYQALTPELVTSTTVDIDAANGAPITDAEQLRGKRLRHDLPQGQVIAAGDIEDKPPIEAGANVRVFANVGRVVVQTRGIAQRDGRMGQRIKVLTANNNEQLAVEVIGENRAMVSNHAQP